MKSWSLVQRITAAGIRNQDKKRWLNITLKKNSHLARNTKKQFRLTYIVLGFSRKKTLDHHKLHFSLGTQSWPLKYLPLDWINTTETNQFYFILHSPHTVFCHVFFCKLSENVLAEESQSHAHAHLTNFAIFRWRCHSCCCFVNSQLLLIWI